MLGHRYYDAHKRLSHVVVLLKVTLTSRKGIIYYVVVLFSVSCRFCIRYKTTKLRVGHYDSTACEIHVWF